MNREAEVGEVEHVGRTEQAEAEADDAEAVVEDNGGRSSRAPTNKGKEKMKQDLTKIRKAKEKAKRKQSVEDDVRIDE